MRKIDLGRLAALLANIGVIIGIIFLGVEIRQSNLVARSQTRTDIATTTAELTFLIVVNDEFSEISHRAGTDPDSLTPVEISRVQNQLGAVLRMWENVHYQYRNGLFDEDEYIAERETMRQFINSGLNPEFWCLMRMQLSERFRQEIETLIERRSCNDLE